MDKNEFEKDHRPQCESWTTDLLKEKNLENILAILGVHEKFMREETECTNHTGKKDKLYFIKIKTPPYQKTPLKMKRPAMRQKTYS